MNRIHIVGRQNHGKTTLIVELVEEFTRRDVRVGTIKHSAHRHELDTPGKDSYRHRVSGAAPAAVVTADLIGAFIPFAVGDSPYAKLQPLFADCRLVLVEGHIEAQAPKIEVWRQEVGGPSLATEKNGIVAVVTDNPLEVHLPIWPRSNIRDLAGQLLEISRHGG